MICFFTDDFGLHKMFFVLVFFFTKGRKNYQVYTFFILENKDFHRNFLKFKNDSSFLIFLNLM
jgi:hypothetical protein